MDNCGGNKPDGIHIDMIFTAYTYYHFVVNICFYKSRYSHRYTLHHSYMYFFSIVNTINLLSVKNRLCCDFGNAFPAVNQIDVFFCEFVLLYDAIVL